MKQIFKQTFLQPSCSAFVFDSVDESHRGKLSKNVESQSKKVLLLGQVSRMTGILEVERSLDSCTLEVHRPQGRRKVSDIGEAPI